MDMPRFDGTGPRGTGPMTGWGLGPCACGMRRGVGAGRGWRFQAEPVALTKDEQVRILESELKDLDAEKEFVLKKLGELKSEV